jgi:hypothetical protein
LYIDQHITKGYLFLPKMGVLRAKHFNFYTKLI